MICNSLHKAVVSCGTAGYWVLLWLPVPLSLAVTGFVRLRLLEANKRKLDAGYTFEQGDVKWSEHTTVVYPLVCALAGLCAGMFGVGGGIVKGPLMIEMGVLPSVSAATASFMIL